MGHLGKVYVFCPKLQLFSQILANLGSLGISKNLVSEEKNEFLGDNFL